MVISRIYLKVLTTLNPYIRKQSPAGHTVLIDTNLYSSQVAVPKMIEWEKITFPERWQITHAAPPKPIVRHNLEDVIQTKGGNVYLRFQRPQRQLTRSMSTASIRFTPSFREPYRVDLPESSRHSSVEPIEAVIQGMSSKPPSNPDHIDPVDPIVQGLQFSPNKIPHGIYEPRTSSSKGPYSPTASYMNFEV